MDNLYRAIDLLSKFAATKEEEKESPKEFWKRYVGELAAKRKDDPESWAMAGEKELEPIDEPEPLPSTMPETEEEEGEEEERPFTLKFNRTEMRLLSNMLVESEYRPEEGEEGADIFYPFRSRLFDAIRSFLA